MYKALVRSHLDYCDTIYHIPALNNQINLGATLTSLMETVDGMGSDGNPYLTGVGAAAFFRFTRYKN